LIASIEAPGGHKFGFQTYFVTDSPQGNPGESRPGFSGHPRFSSLAGHEEKDVDARRQAQARL
jgi:hypothetical protein